MIDYVDKFVGLMKAERFAHKILDVGIGNGEKSLKLAEIGHTVVGITNCEEEYERAKWAARRRGLGNCTFLMMSVEGTKEEFDVSFFNHIIVSKVLHLLPNQAITSTIGTLKSLTAPGGLHIVQGYLVDPALSQSKNNRESMFKPEELARIYAKDCWEITDYAEDPFSRQIAGGKEWVTSLVRMIARKSKAPSDNEGLKGSGL